MSQTIATFSTPDLDANKGKKISKGFWSKSKQTKEYVSGWNDTQYIAVKSWKSWNERYGHYPGFFGRAAKSIDYRVRTKASFKTACTTERWKIRVIKGN